ncbi:MAG: restriction endonuclease subunit S [Eubacteriales bacterium]|nr:restriction endonuclease subunit S [Eubacteriales bacterium]
MNNYKSLPLKEIANINMGQSPPSSTYNTQEEGLPFFQGNADFGEIYPSSRIYCIEPMKTADINDILISVRAPIGAVNIADSHCCIGRGLAAVKPKKNLYYRYLYYALQSLNDELNRQGTGSTFKAIGKSILENAVIPIPTLNEQRKIATKLDTVSDIIRLRKEQLEELDLLVKSRFVEMFGDAIANSRHWPTDTIENLCVKIQGGGTPSKSHPEYYQGDIPWISPKDMKTFIIADSSDYITQTAISNSSASLIPDGAVLIVIRSGILKHTLPVAINVVPVAINQDMKALVPGKKVTSWFLAILPIMLEPEILAGVRGVTADNIDFAVFRKRQVITPPMELQNEFSRFAEQIINSRLKIAKCIEVLDNLRKALMQRYYGVNGNDS